MGLIVRETPREDCASLGATLTLSSSLSTHWPRLISGHPERADIRTTWSEELPPIFNEQLVYKNNPSLTQTTASTHKDQNELLFFFSLSVFWNGRNSICKLHTNIKHENLAFLVSVFDPEMLRIRPKE